MVKLIERTTTVIKKLIDKWTPGVVEGVTAKEVSVLKESSPQVKKDLLGALEVATSKMTGPLEKQMAELEKTHSVITPEAGAEMVAKLNKVGWGVYLGATAAGLAAEVFSLGQVDKVSDRVKDIMHQYGVPLLLASTFYDPYTIGVRTPYKYYLNKKYTPLIPGVSDMVRFVVRDVWDPKIVTPAPKLFKEQMQYLGYSAFWSDAYWTAHWEIPAYTQFRSMFWRGKINKEEFMRGIFLADYHPAYNTTWEELAYDYPGKRDARWMYEWGTIDKEKLTELITAAGVHPDWIEPVVSAYILNILRDEIGRIRSTLIRRFTEDLITEADLREKLKDLGFRPDVIDYSVAEAIERRDLDRKIEMVKVYTIGYRKGKVPEDDLTLALTKIGVSPDRIKLIIDLEKAKKTIKGETEIERAKTLSLGSLKAAWKAKLINEEKVREELALKDYSEEDVEILVKLIAKKPEEAVE